MNNPERFLVERNGMSFLYCLMQCAENKELVSSFDRLRGTNLSHRGSVIDLAIDRATGRLDADMEKFIEFCWEYIFLRM